MLASSPGPTATLRHAARPRLTVQVGMRPAEPGHSGAGGCTMKAWTGAIANFRR